MKNPFGFLKRLSSFIGRILRFAESRGLTDDLVDLALRLVAQAQVQFPNNEARLAFVLDQIHLKTHVPESVARLAVELAIQAYKRRTLGQ